MEHHPLGHHLPRQLSLIHGRVRRRRNHQRVRQRHTTRKNPVSATARPLPAMPGPLRLVDPTLRRMDRLPMRYVGQRHRSVCADFFAQ